MSKDIHKWTTGGRYTLMFDEHTFFVWDNEKEERMTALNVTKKLNEQQATIQELERKVKKYAKIGEEQLKQIMDLQDELNECRARPTLATDERGVVKVEYKCR